MRILESKRGGSKNKSILEWQKATNQARSLVNLNKLNKIFIYCLKELGVNKENLSINLRLYEDLDKNEAINFWSRVTGLSKEKIKYVNILNGKKMGKLKYGMCRVRVIKGGYILKLLQSIRDTIVAKACSCSSRDRAPLS